MGITVDHDATRRELPTDGGVLRYHEIGEGPPLLLLHGSGPGVSGWRNFRHNLGVFAEHFRCLVLELPGFGVSDPVEGHPLLTAPGSVRRFLRELGIDRTAIIGNSMGGIVAFAVAMKEPDLVDRIVTVGGVGTNLLSPGPGEGIRLLAEFADDPSRERLIRWLHAMVFDPEVVTEELVEERWELASDPAALETMRAMYGTAALEARERFMAMSPEPPYWSRLHTVQAPVLLTWGRDDRVSPLDMALVPMRLLPQAELHVFPRCGHWTMIEAKEAWETTVLGFLRRGAEHAA
jgi:pimeloyl-ACP methyl ester carboxylesterase